MASLNRDDIEYAVNLARSKGFRTLELEIGEEAFSAEIALKKAQTNVVPVIESVPTTDPESGTWVKSQVVGYFRPGKSKAKVGFKASEGDLLGEIIALGIVNEVRATVNGSITEVAVKDGDAVEYGQLLFQLDGGL